MLHVAAKFKRGGCAPSIASHAHFARTLTRFASSSLCSVAVVVLDSEDPDNDDPKAAWDAMTIPEQQSFLKAFFRKGGPIRKDLKNLLDKSRTEKINVALRDLARAKMPDLIPFSNDPQADVRTADTASPGPALTPLVTPLCHGPRSSITTENGLRRVKGEKRPPHRKRGSND